MNNLQRVLDVRSANAKLFRICPNCSSHAIAVRSSEDLCNRRVRSLWYCDVCGREFETSADVSASETRN